MLTLLRAPAVRIYLNFDRQCLSDPTLAIGYSTTFDDLTSSNCTTCMVNDDKSAYWIPELVCSSRLLHVKDIVKPLPNLVLSVPERIIRGSRPRRNDSVGLQNGSADEVSLISAPGTISSAAVRTRPCNLSQMGFVCSQETHMSETTQAQTHRRPSLGFGKFLPFFACQYQSSCENQLI